MKKTSDVDLCPFEIKGLLYARLNARSIPFMAVMEKLTHIMLTDGEVSLKSEGGGNLGVGGGVGVGVGRIT